MPLLDDIEFALTDPRSKHFPETMAALQGEALLKEQDKKADERMLLTLVGEAKLAEVSLLEEQQALNETRSKEYLRDYAAYQEKEHEQAVKELEALKSTMDFGEFSDHLNEQHDKLEKEVGVLQIKLENLEAKQTEIKQEWADLQKETAKEFSNKLDTLQIVSADGSSTTHSPEMKTELIDCMAQSSIHDIASKNPDLAKRIAETDPADLASQARTLNHLAGAMSQLKMLKKLEKGGDISASAVKEHKETIGVAHEVMREGSDKAQKQILGGLKNIKDIHQTKKELDPKEKELEAVKEVQAKNTHRFAPRPGGPG